MSLVWLKAESPKALAHPGITGEAEPLS
jgi:hypothetical protein